MKKRLVTILIACLAGIHCGNIEIVQGGGGIETVALAGKAVYEGNAPAASARVLLRQQKYLKDTAGAAIDSIVKNRFDTETDDSGYFFIDSVTAGMSYTLEINDGKSFASSINLLVQNDSSVHHLQTATIRPTGSITGSIDSAAGGGAEWYAQVFGLERAAHVNKATGLFTLTDIPQGVYSIHILSSSLFKPAITHDGISVPYGTSVFLPYVLWRHSQRLSLNTTVSGADVSGTVTGFPVFIRLTNSNFMFSQAQRNGDDLRFTTHDNAPLAYEIERWDSANGAAEIWVKIDTVLGSNDSQYFVMHWGVDSTGSPQNSAFISLSNSTAVFDTAAGFQGVWHLADTSSTTAKDATGNHFDGSKAGLGSVSMIDGMTGKALQFNGLSSYMYMPATAASIVDFPENAQYTLSAWVYADTLDSAFHQILSKGELGYGLQLHNINKWEITEFHDATGWETIRSPATAREWKLVVGVRDGAKEYLYVDGALASDSIITRDSTGRNTNFDLHIGRLANASSRFWQGKIDDVCISSVARSPDWIKLCFMNQQAIDKLVEFR